MQVQTNLKQMFSYSLIPTCVTLFLLVIFFIIIRYMKKKELQKEIVLPSYKNLLVIKNKYLLSIQQLEFDLNNKKITSRKAYQNLSSLIRNFIFEATNIRVQNYTLKEIKTINMPILYELVNEYYDPEFSIISKGNILLSISKTKAVIEKWN